MLLARCFHVSVIHQTLTWTTGSLTCIRNNSYACVYTQGLGTPTVSQHNTFDSSFSCAPDGVRTSGHEILSPGLYQLSRTHAELQVINGVVFLALSSLCPQAGGLNIRDCPYHLRYILYIKSGLSLPRMLQLSLYNVFRCTIDQGEDSVNALDDIPPPTKKKLENLTKKS